MNLFNMKSKCKAHLHLLYTCTLSMTWSSYDGWRQHYALGLDVHGFSECNIIQVIYVNAFLHVWM